MAQRRDSDALSIFAPFLADRADHRAVESLSTAIGVGLLF
jgi:hypothetical protein